MDKKTSDSSCASCAALFQKLTDVNTAAELREEELSSRLEIAQNLMQTMEREIIVLRHLLNRPATVSSGTQTISGTSMLVDAASQTEHEFYVFSGILPPLSPLRTTFDVRSGTSASPNDIESDYEPPVNIADIEYEREMNTINYDPPMILATQPWRPSSPPTVTYELTPRAKHLFEQMGASIAARIPFMPSSSRALVDDLLQQDAEQGEIVDLTISPPASS